MVRNDNTHSRRCLACKREVPTSVEIESVHQSDLARDSETDSKRLVGILLDRPTETTFRRSFLVIRQGCHIDYFSATSSGCIFTESFSTGESNYRIRQKGNLSPSLSQGEGGIRGHNGNKRN